MLGSVASMALEIKPDSIAFYGTYNLGQLVFPKGPSIGLTGKTSEIAGIISAGTLESLTP